MNSLPAKVREMWEAQGEGVFGYFKGMAGN